MPETRKITPFLWFDDEAEQAASLYVSLFDDSGILGITRYGKAGPGPEGAVMLVNFQLAGQPFTALNGGAHVPFTDAISLAVDCEDQAEVDALWDALTADGGEPGRCGWLKDRFGVSWQVVPRALPELMQAGDPERVRRVVEAMLQMTKLDVARLEQAYRGM